MARAFADRIDVFRTEVAAPASPLRLLLQPQQLLRPGVPLSVTAGLSVKGLPKACFQFKMSSSDTLAHVKIQVEKKSGIARNRMLSMPPLSPYGCSDRPNDEDEITTFDPYHYGDAKVHLYVDDPDQVITI